MSDAQFLRDALTPLIGPLASYAERFTLDPPAVGDALLPAAALRDEPALRREIEMTAAREGTDRLLLGAAVWHVAYEVTLLSGALTALAAGLVLDLTPANTRVRLVDGLPRTLLLDRVEIVAVCPGRLAALGLRVSAPACVRVDAEEARRRWWATAVRGNFASVFARVRNVSGLSTNVMWGNVASTAANIFDRLATSPVAAAAEADRRVLLDAELAPDGERNPLARRLRAHATSDTRLPAAIRGRRVCCLYFMLPSDRGMCATCPLLGPAEREARALARLEG